MKKPNRRKKYDRNVALTGSTIAPGIPSGAMTRKPTGSLVRPVTELGDRLVDPLLGRGPHMGLGVDDARDCFYGDAGELGNIEYGSFGHYGSNSVACV